MSFFSLDSKFMQMMTSVGEFLLLNVCWIIGSLPLVTIGASNTAMYTVMGRRLREEGGGTIVPFFKAWWSSLGPTTLFWIAQVFVSVSLVLLMLMPIPKFLVILVGVLLLLVNLVLSLIYPQIARFRNRPFAYLRNAVILLVLKLGWVCLNFLVLLSPAVLFLLFPVEFLTYGFIWLTLGIAGLFYLSASILRKVMQPLEEISLC